MRIRRGGFPALAVIPDGGSGSEAARTGGVGLPVIRDRVLRLNAGGAEALVTRKAPGKTPVLTDEQRTALAATAGAGPRPDIDGIVRWRPFGPAQWAHGEPGVPASRQTPGREPRAMGLAVLSARPQHCAQDDGAIGAFGKTSATPSSTSAPDVAASRQGSGFRTRPGPVRRTNSRDAGRGGGRGPARRTTSGPNGHIPSGPSALPGARAPGWSCPVATLTPWPGIPGPSANRPIAGAHAILIPDQAGSHASTELAVPDNITPVPMPPGSPELNPVGNVRQFIRDKWLSNIVFRNRDDIADHCCQAWNSLMDQTGRIMSIGCREWAQRV